VVWEYRARFFKVDVSLYRNLIVAFIPAAVMGLLFSKSSRGYLFHAVPVALAFIVGGLIILWSSASRARSESKRRAMTWLDALKVGIAQCFAYPGTSRSGATIIGGMLFGLSRKAANRVLVSSSRARRSLPPAATTCGRTARSSPLATSACSRSDSPRRSISAFVVIRWLIRYVATHDFRPFAWYRLAFGDAGADCAYFGWVTCRPSLHPGQPGDVSSR
jgi:undecaprenyl-diphosphatase